jgi:glycosyltransferase involved in cell wall biosynthesis
MTAPLVSLCVPTLNRPVLFRRTLKSLVAQEFRDLEIIVVDNASQTEESRQAVEEMNDSRIRYHRHPTRIGMGANWNSAREMARGKYLAIFHDDDFYHPRAVLEMVERLEADPSLAFVHGATLHVDANEVPVNIQDHGWPDRVEGSEFLRRTALHPIQSMVEAQTVMARADAYRAAGPFLLDWIQATDSEMWLRLCQQGAVGFIRRPLVYVGLRPPSTALPGRLIAATEQARVGEAGAKFLKPWERRLARARQDIWLTEVAMWARRKGGTPAMIRQYLWPYLSPVARTAVGMGLDGPLDKVAQATTALLSERRRKAAER